MPPILLGLVYTLAATRLDSRSLSVRLPVIIMGRLLLHAHSLAVCPIPSSGSRVSFHRMDCGRFLLRVTYAVRRDPPG